MKIRNNKYWFIYFAIGIFVVFGCTTYFAELITKVFGAGHEHIVYAACCLGAAAGVCLLYVLRRMTIAIKQCFLLVAFLLTALLIIIAGFIHRPAILAVTFTLYCLMEGLNAAICAYYLHRLIKTGTKPGTKPGVSLAISSAIGLTVTYVIDFLPVPVYVKAISLAAGLLAMMFLAFRKIKLVSILEPQDNKSIIKSNSESDKKRLLPVILTIATAIAVMSYMMGVNDMVIYKNLLSGAKIRLFIPQALLYLPGLLIAGLLADVKNGRFLPVAILGCTLLTAPVAILANSPDVFTDNSGITYFLGGFYLIYIMISLTSIAPAANHPAIVTSLGVFVFFLFSAAGALSSVFFIRADSMLPLAGYIGLSIILLVVFYLAGNLHPKTTELSGYDTQLPTARQLETLVKSYGFTTRETEVMQYLLDGCQNVDIAENMKITENTVYKYISSMITKTGAKSRSGLIAMFASRKS